MQINRKIFVLMRYSILSIDAARSWKIGQKGMEEYRDTLFDEKRLDLHENLFINLAFKSLKQALDKASVEVSFIMFISSELPQKYKNRLYEMSSDYNFFSIKELSPTDKTIPTINDEVCKNLMGISGDVVYATVRLDDDDAIHPNFFSNLEEYIAPLYAGKGVSFSNGVSGIYNGDKFVSFHKMNAINNAQGQAAIALKNANGSVSGPMSVYSGKVAHSRMHWEMPVIVDGRKPMYIRTVHNQGDFYSNEYEKKMSSAEVVEKEQIEQDFILSRNLVC